jgi:4-hydroxy-tetrahydrodipicolinate synthase
MCGDELNVWSGNDDETVPLMSLGAKGVISVLSNIMPREMSHMTHLMLDGKTQDAAKIQLELLEIMNALFVETNPYLLKPL